LVATHRLDHVGDLVEQLARRGFRITKASGDMIVIRYADDTIVGFQHEHEARAFLDDLKERMRKFEFRRSMVM
jgi:nucleoside diphosphate kinase